MSFLYEPLTEQEAIEERFNLLSEGEYDAVITASTDKTSSSGNPMMDMTVQVFDANGKARDVRDFLVFTRPMMWKIVHFADSAGVAMQYGQGKLCSEIAIGRRVRVKVGIEEGGLIPEDKLKGKPLGTKYSDKNKIEDYIKQGKNREWAKATAVEALQVEDEDVPF